MIGKIAALRDDWIMHSTLAPVGDLSESVLLPMLRQLGDDCEAVDSGLSCTPPVRPAASHPTR